MLACFLLRVAFVLDWPARGSVSMVVLDELELPRPQLQPRFLLHTMDEPRIDGNKILARHGGGRLTTTVLLPEPARVEKIGGEGREFEVDGKNYPLKRPMLAPNTPGAWRTEITGGAGRSRRFITMLAPANVDAPIEPTPSVDESASGWRARQADL